jgi:hypothetical protein
VDPAVPAVLAVLVALVVLVALAALADLVDPVDLAVLPAGLAVPAVDPMPCVSRCWTPRGGRQFWTTW